MTEWLCLLLFALWASPFLFPTAGSLLLCAWSSRSLLQTSSERWDCPRNLPLFSVSGLRCVMELCAWRCRNDLERSVTPPSTQLIPLQTKSTWWGCWLAGLVGLSRGKNCVHFSDLDKTLSSIAFTPSGEVDPLILKYCPWNHFPD